MNKKTKLCIVGLGLHAKRAYLSKIDKYDIDLALVIDLKKNEKTIKEYLLEKGFASTRTYFLEDEAADDIELNEKYQKELSSILKEKGIMHAVISTEPKAHHAYLKFFIKNNINVLMDKPIFAFQGMIYDQKAVALMDEKFKKMIDLYRRSDSKVYINCQRRYNDAYSLIKKEISSLIEKYNVGITNIDIVTNDGTWNMIDEFFSRENHPYKYGYGKLLHSGYHFIDLLMYLLEENTKLKNKQINKISVKSSYISLKDYLEMIRPDEYDVLFNKSCEYAKYLDKDTFKMGEIDFSSIIEFKQDDNTLCLASLNLLQSGFSKRSWTELPIDTYKGNGRVKQSYLSLNLGPLYSVKITANQGRFAYEEHGNKEEGYNDHFHVEIYRNSSLIGGEPFTSFDLSDLLVDNSLGYNEVFKERCFKDFILLNESECDLNKQINTMNLLSCLYRSARKEYIGGFKINEQ